MIAWWQHIPEHIDPIAFTVGFFSVHWYALFWLGGFVAAFVWARRFKSFFDVTLSDEGLFDLFLLLFLGAFFGGHLGYAILYRPDIFLANPWGFFLPYQEVGGGWSGIAGMSFHGGLTGVLSVLILFVRRKNLSFWSVADLIAFAAPVAIFFGRLGNFFALELYGRVTRVVWGMYFPGDPGGFVLRHPSSLYEAIGEGAFLLLSLFLLRRVFASGQLAASFLFGYGTIRFFIEYLREPDRGLALVFGILTRGQFFSLFLMVFGTLLFLWLRQKNYGKINT